MGFKILTNSQENIYMNVNRNKHLMGTVWFLAWWWWGMGPSIYLVVIIADYEVVQTAETWTSEHMHIQARVILLFNMNSFALYGMCYEYILVFLLEQTHLLTHGACALHRGRPLPSIMCFPPTPPRNRCTTPAPSRLWKVGMSQALNSSVLMTCFYVLSCVPGRCSVWI